MTDRDYIKIAIDISKNSEFPYGAIIVKNDKIVGRSDAVIKDHGNRLYTHSEYRAIQNAIESGFAGDRYGGLYGGLEGCTIYTSCQPCMICMGVILYKKIDKIVYAATLQDSSKYVVQEIETDTKELAKLSNANVEVIPELEREYAVEVLKEWSEKQRTSNNGNEKSLLDCDWVVKNFSKVEANKLKTIVIAVHGFSSSRNSFDFEKIAPALKENNIGLVCFDLPGHGLRKNEKLNVQACLNSIKNIEDEIRSFYFGPISLTGASFGGFLLLRYLENNKKTYGKVILRAPALEEYDICKNDTIENWSEMIECLDSGKNYFRDNMEVEVSMLDDYFKFDIFNHLNIKEDVKLIYCSEGKSVNNDNIFKLSKLKNWQLFEVQGADHFCRRKQDIERITQLFLDILK